MLNFYSAKSGVRGERSWSDTHPREGLISHSSERGPDQALIRWRTWSGTHQREDLIRLLANEENTVMQVGDVRFEVYQALSWLRALSGSLYKRAWSPTECVIRSRWGPDEVLSPSLRKGDQALSRERTWSGTQQGEDLGPNSIGEKILAKILVKILTKILSKS